MRFFISARGVPGRLTAAAAVAMVVCTPGWADTQKQAAEAVPAVWAAKELRFVYMGFTSTYSCDGLRDKVRGILLKLGARPDLQVRESPCAGALGGPTPFPGVTIKMNVLQPATAQSGAGEAQTVQAHWQSVDVSPDRDPLLAAGDCELVEQVKQSILPMFTTRNVAYSSTCIPHQLSIGGTTLKAEVLVAEHSAAKGPAPK